MQGKRTQEDYPLNRAIETDETEEALQKHKNNKEPGTDLITNEALKNGGSILVQALTMLLNYIWMYEQIPHSWKLAMMNPRYKKNSRHNTKNYRPITYLSNLFKLLERILDNRFKEIFTACPEQAGFTKGRGTIDQLIRLQEIITYLNEKKGPWLAFIDIQEAFERVWHTGLFYRLWKAGIKGKAWRVTKDMYTDMNAFVRTNHGDTEHFQQDCRCSKIMLAQETIVNKLLNKIYTDHPHI